MSSRTGVQTVTSPTSWYCDIEDYTPFAHSVPVKHDGGYFEQMKTPLDWRTAVREVSEVTFNRILQVAGVGPLEPGSGPTPGADTGGQPSTVPVNEVTRWARWCPDSSIKKKPGEGGAFPRWSRGSKLVGDRAEEIVYRHPQATLPAALRETVRWVAKAGEQPGWDVEYRSNAGDVIVVEVKGTTAKAFASVDVTANEWQQAEATRAWEPPRGSWSRGSGLSAANSDWMRRRHGSICRPSPG